MSGYYNQSESFNESSSYDDQYSRGGGRRGYDDQSYSQSESFSEQSSEGYGGGGGRGMPPPPNVPWPWRPRWDDRSQRYCFEHSETGETVWSFEEVQTRVRQTGSGGGGGYYEQTDRVTEEESSYSRGGGGYGPPGRGYGGGSEQIYESEQVTEESRGGGRSGGHGLAYGALGAVGGLAAGAFAMYEGEKIHNDYEEDKYRVEEGFDNVVDDVEDAPENVAGWVGDKVGEVDRFGDNVENAYDDGKVEGEYGNDY